MESETDVEILQLYIDLFGEKLGFSERVELIDRVILLAKKEGERLHYRCLKALGYLMVEDQQGAERELLFAIENYQASREGRLESPYEKHHYAMASELLGRLKNDTEFLDQAEQICRELLESDNWTKFGRADVYRQLGDVLRCKSEWVTARDAYVTAFDNHPRQVFKVFLAECLLNLEGAKTAASILDSIATTELEPGEFLDYVFTFAVVAIEGAEKEMLKSAEDLLRQLDIPTPYFRAYRDSLLLSIIDTLRSGPPTTPAQRARLLLKGTASTIIRYMKLEPNFMGIGVNVGKMIEDFSKGETERSGKAPKKAHD